MSHIGKRYAIIGAGVAGLTLAYELSRKGACVDIIEAHTVPGGLARSFVYGDFTFDIGPHRFHTYVPEVEAFLSRVLGDDLIEIRRSSGVRMFQKYFNWPLDLSALRGMPPSVLMSMIWDLVFRSGKGESFQDYILEKYGKTLYRVFFEEYTEKFLGLPCSEVSRDWAMTGIERAVIDQSLRMDNLFQLARSVLRPNKPLVMLYPMSGGIGVFAMKLARMIQEMGGNLHLGQRVTALYTEGGKILSVSTAEREYSCDEVVWTGAITDVLRLLGLKSEGLEYLHLILFSMMLDHPPLVPYHWCYFGEKRIPFCRVSIPSLFNPDLAPHGRSGLCVERVCRNGDPLWNEPEQLFEDIRNGLEETGLIRSGDSIVEHRIERVSHAYPLYDLGYRQRLDRDIQRTKVVSNLILLGRQASFWYNNMDHSIDAALKLSKEIS